MKYSGRDLIYDLIADENNTLNLGLRSNYGGFKKFFSYVVRKF